MSWGLSLLLCRVISRGTELSFMDQLSEQLLLICLIVKEKLNLLKSQTGE